MKTDAIAPIKGKILDCRCSANKIGMIAGIALKKNRTTKLNKQPKSPKQIATNIIS
jgi:hypothetical protein